MHITKVTSVTVRIQKRNVKSSLIVYLQTQTKMLNWLWVLGCKNTNMMISFKMLFGVASDCLVCLGRTDPVKLLHCWVMVQKLLWGADWPRTIIPIRFENATSLWSWQSILIVLVGVYDRSFMSVKLKLVFVFNQLILTIQKIPASFLMELIQERMPFYSVCNSWWNNRVPHKPTFSWLRHYSWILLTHH